MRLKADIVLTLVTLVPLGLLLIFLAEPFGRISGDFTRWGDTHTPPWVWFGKETRDRHAENTVLWNTWAARVAGAGLLVVSFWIIIASIAGG